MKLDEIPDLPTINLPSQNEAALIARLAYAKELLQRGIDPRFIPPTDHEMDVMIDDVKAFIEKLNSEGL